MSISCEKGVQTNNTSCIKKQFIQKQQRHVFDWKLKILYSSAHYCLSWVLCTVLEYQKYRYMLMIFKKALKDMNIKCCFQKQFKWKKRLWSHTHSCPILLKQLFITWTLTSQCQLDATRIFQFLLHIFQLNRHCRKKSHQVETKLIQ